MIDHPNFHRARKDKCPEIAQVRCPDCGARLHFDTSAIQPKSYQRLNVKTTVAVKRPVIRG